MLGSDDLCMKQRASRIYWSPVHDADCPVSSLERKLFSVGLELVWSSQIRMSGSCLSFPCGFSHHKVIALAKKHGLYHFLL